MSELQKITEASATLFQKEEVLNKSFLFVLEEEFLPQFMSSETKNAYRRDISQFLVFSSLEYLSDLAQLHYSDLSKIVLTFIHSHKKTASEGAERIMNPKTLNRKAYALSSFFNFLVDTYHYPKNPLKRYSPEPVHKTSTTDSLNRVEIIELISLLKEKQGKNKLYHRNYLIIAFLFGLALRRNEVAHLQWEDIGFQSSGIPSLTIYQKGRSLKVLPLPLPLYTSLMEYKEKYANSFYIFTPIRNNATPSKDITKSLSSTQINRIVTTIAQELFPEKNITPHSFRKTFIELALNNNTPMVEIMNATGHASVEMVKYYDGRSTLEHNAVNSVYIGII